MPSIVSTFPADDLVAGRATRDHPGCAVRIYIADDVLEDGLDAHYEILGGTPEAREGILEECVRLYEATFKVTQDRQTVWRANACFHATEVLENHPIFGRLLSLRQHADRTLMVFEAGKCIIRMDFDGEHAIQTWEQQFRDGMAELGCPGTVRVAELDRSLEDWRPL